MSMYAMKPSAVSVTTENNSHVKDYLAYYTALPHSPHHAVMINGPWGIGKTWFVKTFLRQHVGQDKKYIYISLYGLATAFLSRKEAAEVFVTRAQLRRVMAVFVPTFLFCLATQYLGLYVASFLLIAGFMRMVGKIALWKSLLTAFIFTAVMFVTFDIAFDVIMPKGPLEAAFGH